MKWVRPSYFLPYDGCMLRTVKKNEETLNCKTHVLDHGESANTHDL